MADKEKFPIPVQRMWDYGGTGVLVEVPNGIPKDAPPEAYVKVIVLKRSKRSGMKPGEEYEAPVGDLSSLPSASS